MKRIGFLYEKMCDRDFIRKAIKGASKGKTRRPYVAKVLANQEHYVDLIYDMLKNQNVILTKPRTKTIFDNSSLKERQIKIPAFFPDQIIHWCMVMALQPIMERGMYEYCCGSVPKRGGTKGKRYLERVLRKDKSLRYCMKLDIRKFFPSVRNNRLMAMFGRKIKDPKMLNLIGMVLDNGGDGLPIGYYTSQWFSNFYLEGLDHHIKERGRIKVYVRYVDDVVMLDANKRKMRKCMASASDAIGREGLSFKGNWQLWPLGSRPIDFLGYRFFLGRTQLRKRIYHRLKRRTDDWRAYFTIGQARGIVSLIGWLSQIGTNLYREMEPLKARLSGYIGDYERRRNHDVQQIQMA